MRSKNGLSVIAAEDLAKIPSEMKNLIREMINADQNMRPSCRDLLNNKIITTRVSTTIHYYINIETVE